MEFLELEKITKVLQNRCEAIVEFEHDGHHVHLIELPTSSGRRWKFSVVVCWESEGSRRVRALSCIGRAFETAHNARLEGIEFTKRWIDEGKPAPH